MSTIETREQNDQAALNLARPLSGRMVKLGLADIEYLEVEAIEDDGAAETTGGARIYFQGPNGDRSITIFRDMDGAWLLEGVDIDNLTPVVLPLKADREFTQAYILSVALDAIDQLDAND